MAQCYAVVVSFWLGRLTGRCSEAPAFSSHVGKDHLLPRGRRYPGETGRQNSADLTVAAREDDSAIKTGRSRDRDRDGSQSRAKMRRPHIISRAKFVGPSLSEGREFFLAMHPEIHVERHRILILGWLSTSDHRALPTSVA